MAVHLCTDGGVEDTVAPVLTGQSPSGGATGGPTNHGIMLAFCEAIGANGGTVRAQRNATDVFVMTLTAGASTWPISESRDRSLLTVQSQRRRRWSTLQRTGSHPSQLRLKTRTSGLQFVSMQRDAACGVIDRKPIRSKPFSPEPGAKTGVMASGQLSLDQDAWE